MRRSSVNRNLRPSALTRLARSRSGAFIAELVVGAVLLGVFLSTVGPMFRWIRESKRTSEQHLIAMQELSTLMELLAALPPTSLTNDAVQSLAVSDSTKTLLPDSELSAALDPEDRLQRVTLKLLWTNEAGMSVEPKQLTAWFPLEVKEETE